MFKLGNAIGAWAGGVTIAAGFDSKYSSCSIKKWGAFGPLLDELRHPLPSNALRRIFEEQFASIVGT